MSNLQAFFVAQIARPVGDASSFTGSKILMNRVYKNNNLKEATQIILKNVIYLSKNTQKWCIVMQNKEGYEKTENLLWAK